MGHHPVLAVTPRRSDADVDEVLERDALRGLRTHARRYRVEAVNLLVKLMRGEIRTAKGGPTPPSLRLKAAHEIIELGFGKTGTQDLPRLPAGGPGIVVNILNFSGEAAQTRTIEAAEPALLTEQTVDAILARDAKCP